MHSTNVVVVYMLCNGQIMTSALCVCELWIACTVIIQCRKDFFYSYDEYPEANLPDPVDGGRFHLVSVSETNGSVSQVTLNGKPVTFEAGQNPDTWFVDWMHIYPTVLAQGQPVWISFHTRYQNTI